MKDKILTMFFDINRWTKAIEKGVLKDIRKSELIKLTEEPTRIRMAEAMLNGKYQITPPHIAQIPKDNGEFRTVYVNEPIDRIILSIANDLLFDLMPEMIHPACKSYQVGIGCGKVVLEVSHTIVNMKSDGYVGWKSDLSKYFDSVPIQFIDAAFDKVEAKCGHSVLIDVLRKYYHCGLYFDENNELHEKYQSLKQGCAVASWLANVLLYSLDDELSQLNGFYVRYSDDMLFVGPDYEKAMTILQKRLAEKSMNLNPKKVDFKTRSFKLNGQYIIQNSQYEGDLGVELCASLDEFLSNVEHLYTRYKHSIPSTMSECKSRKYFKALSDKDLEDEDMLFGVGRDIAQVELELYILCQIILGIGWDANKMGKWFWQSNKDRDLVILKNWVTVEK